MTGAWADEVTYTFSSKDWKAKIGNTNSNWTSGKDGAGFSNNGIQVTENSTGANGTSPVSYNNISKIVVTYNTNKSAGAGSISTKIGENTATTNNVSYSGSADGRTANFTTEFNYTTPQTGNVKLTVNTTTNSIYLCSVTITYSSQEEGYVATPTFSLESGAVPYGTTVTLTQDDAEMILYTTNKEIPSYENEVGDIYTEPISITSATTIKAIAVDSEGK